MNFFIPRLMPGNPAQILVSRLSAQGPISPGLYHALEVAFGLLKEEGLSLGLSSGVNVAAAIRLARKLGAGKTIVTILCDPGSRYQSRLYNPEFLRSKGLSPPEWLVQPQRLEPDFVETT